MVQIGSNSSFKSKCCNSASSITKPQPWFWLLASQFYKHNKRTKNSVTFIKQEIIGHVEVLKSGQVFVYTRLGNKTLWKSWQQWQRTSSPCPCFSTFNSSIMYGLGEFIRYTQMSSDSWAILPLKVTSYLVAGFLLIQSVKASLDIAFSLPRQIGNKSLIIIALTVQWWLFCINQVIKVFLWQVICLMILPGKWNWHPTVVFKMASDRITDSHGYHYGYVVTLPGAYHWISSIVTNEMLLFSA